MNKPHEYHLRVYYENTDAGGIVYHANYLNFCERARTELLRETGLTNNEVRHKEGVIFVLRHATCDYLAPAFLEDDLTVRTHLTELKNSSMVLRQQVFKGETMIFSADIVLVCVHAENIKPFRIPNTIRDHFATYLKTQQEENK